jgi:exosortase/archaeosortase family protein
VIFGYFADHRTIMRVTIAASTVPLAILMNGMRIAGTGIAAHQIGPAAAEGFFHTFSGWLAFLCAVGVLAAFVRLLQSFAPPEVSTTPATAEAQS